MFITKKIQRRTIAQIAAAAVIAGGIAVGATAVATADTEPTALTDMQQMCSTIDTTLNTPHDVFEAADYQQENIDRIQVMASACRKAELSTPVEFAPVR